MNFTDWSEEITKNLKQAQEQYWKHMAELHAKATSAQPSDTPNMTEGLERLWSLISPQMPGQADDVMQQVFSMGKGHNQSPDNFSAWKDMVDSLVESQLHSFGIPTKKAQEELLQQVEALTLENQTLKARIKELEAGVTETPKKESKSKAKRVSTPAGVKKMPKSTAKAKPLSKAKPETSKPAATAKPATKPSAAKKKVTAPKITAAKTKPDDLSKIKGIGPVIQKQLIAAGVSSFAQIAALTKDQAQKLDDELLLKGRIQREDWVKQAAALAS